MDLLDMQWLLLALPVVFALGWMASRFDVRQVRRDGREAPKAYFKGLNLLLNEQPDKAIDAFIEAVQHDPDTTELHFGLGNLFRRRGDFERAVRVHQHLLGRGDLNTEARSRARYALAQDFMKAGLFDRAEATCLDLLGSDFDSEARLALLSLHERARDWPAARRVAQELEARGSGSFATRIAHYDCEMALEADAHQSREQADRAVAAAREVAPRAVRPALLQAQRLAQTGEHRQALLAWTEALRQNPAAWPLAAADFAASALASGEIDAARTQLDRAYATEPCIDLFRARLALQPPGPLRDQMVLEHLSRHPGLSAATLALELPAAAWDQASVARLRETVADAAKPLQRYRCAACGFEAQHYFWQCPGCQGWDTFPPRRLESL